MSCSGSARNVARGLPVLIAVAVSASAWSAPSPSEPSVQDRARVIRPDVRAAMEARHRRLLEDTGVTIVMVTVPRLDRGSIEELALAIGGGRGVGRRAQDRGVALALSVGDREIFVATGYGVEGILPPGRVDALVAASVMPFLRRDDFTAALDNASIAIVRAIADEHGVSPDRREALRVPPDGPPATGPGQVIGVLAGVTLLWLLFRRPELVLALLVSGVGRGSGGFGGGFGGGGFGGFGSGAARRTR